MRVLMLAYSALLSLGLVVSAPWWLLRMATTQRYREGLLQRLGFVPTALRVAVGQRKIVWVHAVSVGEVLAASRLVVELEAALGEGWGVVVSTTTRTGQALARERFGPERVFYVPLDFAFAARAYMRVLKPAALVLMESEVWPRMMWECERAGIPVVVVNARVSDRSFSRGTRVRGLHFWGSVLRRVSLWLAQSEEDARRLVAMGAKTEAVRVGGNLKYDVLAPKGNWVAESIAKAAAGRPLIVAGSTVGAKDFDEEKMVLAAWRFAARKDSKAILVLAPRHPERFEAVEDTAREYWVLTASEVKVGGRCVDPFAEDPLGEVRPDVEVIVVDSIGDLSAVYGIADIAFVGGSLVPKGGHNPLEPAQYGVPVVMGPSFENFRDIVAKMQAVDGIKIVQDDGELEEVLVDLLTNRQSAKAMGARGQQVFEAQQGATARAVEAIVAMTTGVKA
jgi:3-deoxy-D-manno-octulosonic-acid transferase